MRHHAIYSVLALAAGLGGLAAFGIRGGTEGSTDGAGGTPAARQDEVVSVRGTVDTWRLDRDGEVQFRIAPSREEREDARPRWFHLRASRNADTHPEIQLLMTLLAVRKQAGAPELVTVLGEIKRDHRGRTPETALTFRAISSP